MHEVYENNAPPQKKCLLRGSFVIALSLNPLMLLSRQRALHVRALRPFRDAGGRDRRTGEEWLVTVADREAHIPSVAEEVVGVVDVTTLSSREYCVILDPVGPDGKPQLGQKRVVKVVCFYVFLIRRPLNWPH